MLDIEINIVDRATSGLRRVSMAVEGPQINEVVGLAGMDLVKTNFIKLDAERPNQLGGRRTHFYSEAAEGTTFSTNEAGATVSVTKTGIKTRYLGTSYLPGGAILPVNATKLAIPATSEAYGKGPREFDDLVPVFKRGPGGVSVFALAKALQQPVSTTKKRKSGEAVRGKVQGGEIMYWLVDSVVQDPDPTILPTAEEIQEVAYAAVDRFFDGLMGEVEFV